MASSRPVIITKDECAPDLGNHSYITSIINHYYTNFQNPEACQMKPKISYSDNKFQTEDTYNSIFYNFLILKY